MGEAETGGVQAKVLADDEGHAFRFDLQLVLVLAKGAAPDPDHLV